MLVYFFRVVLDSINFSLPIFFRVAFWAVMEGCGELGGAGILKKLKKSVCDNFQNFPHPPNIKKQVNHKIKHKI
jgi:hypothetical protein